MNLFDLMAKITLDSSEYEKGLDKSEKASSSFGQKLKTGLATAGKVGAAAIGAIATGTAALGTALVKGAGEVAAYGDNIDKMSQKMGISSTAYQEWDAILQHSGTSIDGMQRGMMTLSKAAETGSDAFAKLGLSQEDVASMNQEELFAATIKGLQGMEEGTERAVLAQQLLGGAAKELGPLLNTSAEDTEAMRQRVHELGGVMSDEAVKSAAGYQDALQDMQTAFGGLKNNLFSEFMPGITSVMGGITEIFSGDSDSGVGQVSAGISDIISRISTGMPKLLQIGGQIVKGLLSAISSNLPLILSQGAVILKELSMGLIQALPELLQSGLSIILELANSIVEALPELIPTILEVVMSIADMLTDPATLVSLLDAAIQIIMALANGLIQAVPQLISRVPEIVINLVSAIIQATPLLLKAGAELIKKLLEGATKVFTSLVTAGRQIIDKLKEGLSTAFNALRDWVGEKFETLKEKITGPFEKARDAIKGIVDKIKGFFDFTAKTPKIKLPHIVLDPPDWTIGDLFTKGIPKISISWYKKAYDNPYLFTQPTVVGNRGFGDGQGGEIVYGHENLMDDIRAASANDERIDTIIALLREIVENGLTANIGKNQLYKTMADMNRSRNYATGYNGFSGV